MVSPFVIKEAQMIKWFKISYSPIEAKPNSIQAQNHFLSYASCSAVFTQTCNCQLLMQFVFQPFHVFLQRLHLQWASLFHASSFRFQIVLRFNPTTVSAVLVIIPQREFLGCFDDWSFFHSHPYAIKMHDLLIRIFCVLRHLPAGLPKPFCPLNAHLLPWTFYD